MERTTKDNEYLLNELCSEFSKKLKSNIQKNEYMIQPKSKTLYIVNRKNISKK